MGTTGKTFKERLEAELSTRNWRVADLARASDIPASTLYEIWNRDAWPQPDTMDKIAKGLGVTVASLISKGHLVTHNQALEIVSESVALAQKLGPLLVARLTAMSEAEISNLEAVLLSTEKNKEKESKDK